MFKEIVADHDSLYRFLRVGRDFRYIGKDQAGVDDELDRLVIGLQRQFVCFYIVFAFMRGFCALLSYYGVSINFLFHL